MAVQIGSTRAGNLSFDEFKLLYGTTIVDRFPLPEKLRSIDTFVKDMLGKKAVSTSKVKIDMMKKRFTMQFESERAAQAKERISKCFALYTNAAESSHDSVPIIIGDRSLTQTESMLRNFGAISSGKPRVSKYIDLLPTEIIGGINYESSWDPVKNDMFMLGAISAGKPFHVFKFDSIPMYHLWNEEHNTPRMLCREIIILILNGYKPVIHPFLGISFEPPCTGESRVVVNYDRLLDDLGRISTKEDLILFFRANNIPIE